MKILGVDPGSTRIGYGLIEKTGSLSLIRYGVLEMQSKTGPERIHELAHAFRALLVELAPDIAGIETLYFSKNQKTALQVAESRGVLLLGLKEYGLPIREFRPGDVKLAVANYALADKIAVAKMVKKILGVSELVGYDDASDALAIAIAAAHARSWEEKVASA
jgi:crossover junction endodeoxyribonuclease RuvC